MTDILPEFKSSYPPASSLQEATQFLSLHDVQNIMLSIKGSPLTEQEEEELYSCLRNEYRSEQLGKVKKYLIK